MMYNTRTEKLSGDSSAYNVVNKKVTEDRLAAEAASLINPSNLSSRAADLKLAAKEFENVMEVWNDFYDPVTNPNGIFSLGVAENSLMHDELSKFLNDNLKILPFQHTYGAGPAGTVQLREKLADIFNQYFNPAKEVDMKQIIVTAGVTSVVQSLTYLVGDEGDGILVGRPLYMGFVHDIHTKNKVHLVPVSLREVDDPLGLETVRLYEEELKNQHNAGTKIKGMILCNPHNPLGKCYSREVIVEYMKLCQKYKIHFIADEVYALSVFKTDDTDSGSRNDFVSALSVDTKGIIDPSLVTVVYGMSKDFGSNGFRCAALVSQANQDLLQAYGTINTFSWPSSISELAWSTILKDESFLSFYISENQKRLSSTYSTLTSFLKKHEIPYIPAYAGFFVWCDFRNFLPPLPKLKPHQEFKLNPTKIPWATDEERWRDDEFYRRMIKARLYCATSSAFYGEQHGWYRITFSMPEKDLKFGLDRLEKLLEMSGDGWKNYDGPIGGIHTKGEEPSVDGVSSDEIDREVQETSETLRQVAV